MQLALFGLPQSGKTTLIEGVHSINPNISLLEADSPFPAPYSSDPPDIDAFDAILFLYCKPSYIRKNLAKNLKQKYTNSFVQEYQSHAISELREICHRKNKNIYVLDCPNYCTNETVAKFITQILQGFDVWQHSLLTADKIAALYPHATEIYLIDGNRTLINENTFVYSYGDHELLNLFGMYNYTGWQSFLLEETISDLKDWKGKHAVRFDRIHEFTLNAELYDQIKDKPYVVLTCGCMEIWERIASLNGFSHVFASPLNCADAKYYITKILQSKGYKVIAYGDSKNDIYMLRAADEGYLRILGKLHPSLRAEELTGLHLLANPLYPV